MLETNHDKVTDRVMLYQAIQTLPNQFLPELAEFIVFLQMKSQEKINIKTILSNNIETNNLEQAAQSLYKDYAENKELTEFLNLDGEDFYV
jgi:dephospho-CoA kinase